MAENPFQQQLDLDSLEIGLESLPVGIADRWRLGFRYLYSHTRNSDNSCSVSTGFVM